MLKESVVDYDPESGCVLTPPQQIFLESSARCNLACVTCSTDFGDKSRPEGRDMPIAVVERLGPWLDSARFLNLNGLGEPLLAKNIGAIIEFVSGSAVELSFNTNGTLLTPERCDQMVAAGLHSIAVSIDGIETNRPVRGVPYDFVRQKLLMLHEAKVRAGSALPHIAVAFTLMRRNLEELPRLLRDLLPLGILHGVHVQPLVVFYEALRHQNVYLSPDVERVLDECEELAARYKTTLALHRASLPQDESSTPESEEVGQLGSRSERYGCIDPFFMIQIQATGDVTACCYGLPIELNVLTTPLDEIWNGPTYRALRKRLYAGEFTGRCDNCPFIFGSRESVDSQVDTRALGRHPSREAQFLAEN